MVASSTTSAVVTRSSPGRWRPTRLPTSPGLSLSSGEAMTSSGDQKDLDVRTLIGGDSAKFPAQPSLNDVLVNSKNNDEMERDFEVRA